MSCASERNRTITAALLLALLLVAGTIAASLLVKSTPTLQTEEAFPSSNANESLEAEGKSSDHYPNEADPADTPEEFDPDLRYKTQFFIVDVPPSWKGRWNFKETTSEREAWSQIESYYFTFVLDSEPQFELGFTLEGLGSILPRLGSVNGYSGHIFSDNLTIEDRHYIIDHLTLLNQDDESSNDS